MRFLGAPRKLDEGQAATRVAAEAGGGQAREYRLGVGEKWWQFSPVAVTTLLVGMTIGVERVALAPLAKRTVAIVSVLHTGTFVAVFGLTKSIAGLLGGQLSDRAARRRLMLAGGSASPRGAPRPPPGWSVSRGAPDVRI